MTSKGRVAWWLPMVLAAAAIVAAALIGTAAEWLRLLGRLHPVLVHFPIALILAAGLFELISARRSKPESARIAHACLALGALAALIAAGSGWLNAEHESQSKSLADTLFWHRWTGVSVAVLASVSLGAARLKLVRVHRVGLLAACALVCWGGHLGGVMVYGEGYFTEVFQGPPAPGPAPDQPAGPTSPDPAPHVPPPDGETPSGEQGFDPGAASVANVAVQADGIDFATRVAPILRERCISCHGPAKKKGNLRLDRRELVFGEDPDVWVVVPEHPEESELYRLVTLPENDLDRMPGKGDSLSSEQIDVLRRWIAAGAIWPPGFVIEAESAELETGARSETPAPAPLPQPAGAAALEGELLAAIRARGAHAAPIAQNETGVEVNLSLARERVVDSDLALLDGMQSHLVWLNLARTAVSDDGLKRLEGFEHLQRLHLEGTPISDAGLAHLAGLEQLEYLNLYGTAVTDAGLKHLHGLHGLRRLFVWQTGVTEDGIEALRAALPQLEVIGAAELDLPIEAPAEEAQSLPECCAAAQAQGGECSHDCCALARGSAQVCEVCLRR